jgi:hypothetical protein
MVTDISIYHIFIKSDKFVFVIHILWYNFMFFLLYLPYHNKNIIYKENKKFYFIILLASLVEGIPESATG